MRQEEKWMMNYRMLEAYVMEHGQLPDKKKVDNRGLLNWWKYNMKKLKAGTLSRQQLVLLERLSESRIMHRAWGEARQRKGEGPYPIQRCPYSRASQVDEGSWKYPEHNSDDGMRRII